MEWHGYVHLQTIFNKILRAAGNDADKVLNHLPQKIAQLLTTATNKRTRKSTHAGYQSANESRKHNEQCRTIGF